MEDDMYEYKIRWISGRKQGLDGTMMSDDKLRIGSVRVGHWDAKYKIIERRTK